MHSPLQRLLVRGLGWLALRQVRVCGALEALLARDGPFVLAANHGSRREAVYLPILLLLWRGGRPVHFLGDWNFRLIPGIGWAYDRAGVITVARKPARPAVLTHFRRRYRCGPSALAQARACLTAGRPIGLFPEGTVNRRRRLLPGLTGAARLSLETGAPVVPLGIRWVDPRRRGGPMILDFGEAMQPPPLPALPTAAAKPGGAATAAWHAAIMAAIAERCGKPWSAPPRSRTPSCNRRGADAALPAAPLEPGESRC